MLTTVLLWFLGDKGLADILSGFKKTLTELEELSARNSRQCELNVETISALSDENQMLRLETDKACQVADNIRQFIKE